MIDRFLVLRQQDFPSLDDLISAARWPALVLFVGCAVAFVNKLLRRYGHQEAGVQDSPLP
jgi:hypothetical protein